VGPESRIGRYRIEKEIGRGTMGIVYRAHDPDLDRIVALKTVQLTLAVSPEERTAFEKRFLAEARASALLSHPAIVVVHDAGRDPESGILYITFEFLEGPTLAEAVAARGRLEWKEAVALILRVASGLQHAHARGVIHRDIKPANIMVLQSGEPKIMDFGIAKVPTDHLTSTGQVFGTPSYMSPEQAAAAPLDGRSDLFSLGAVLYLLLSGQTAFLGDSLAATVSQVLYFDPVPPSGLTPGLPPAFDSVLARALAKRPDDRYPDVEAFASDLEDVLAGRAEPGLPGAGVGPARPSPLPAAAGDPPASAVRRLLRSLVERAGPLSLRGRWHPPRRLLVGAVAVLPLVLLTSAVAVRLCGRWLTPTQVEVNFEHPLRSGVLKVFVDDELVLEEPLQSSVTEDLVVVKVRRGRLTKAFDVPPGPHEVRLGVVGEGYSGSRRLEGRFESGKTQRLEVRLGGLIKKELTAWWSP
jgi:hypothetical protein